MRGKRATNRGEGRRMRDNDMRNDNNENFERGKTLKNKNKALKRILICLLAVVLIIAGGIFFVKKIYPNYLWKKNSKINMIINNNNSLSFVNDIYVENGVIYVSKDDLSRYFDTYITIDKKTNQLITTYDKHIAVLPIGEKRMKVNGIEENINGAVVEKNGVYYVPFSELKLVYDAEISYIESNLNVVVDSYSRALKQMTVSNNTDVKWKKTIISSTVDKVTKDEVVTIIDKIDDWYKIRTPRGEIGYVKADKLTNENVVREEMVEDKRDTKISMLFDYYSDYGVCPDRSDDEYKGLNVVSPAFFSLVKLGQGELVDKVGNSGLKYIDWAKDNKYEVWAMVQNDGMQETTSEILNDYNLREQLIEDIVSKAIKYRLDGINIDFENIKYADKDLFTRFIIELYPRLKDYGIKLSVDVTAPDGSENWSLCYDRMNLSKNADYLVFMGYDQYGNEKVGTTAGYDWVKTSLDKFTNPNRENVSSDKLILAMPFYTKLWKDEDPTVISMKNVEKYVPDDVNKVWDDTLRQNYVEYEKDGVTCKMWIEDEKSLSHKLDLVNEYKLAGAAYWVADMEPDSIWQLISEKLGL